MSKFLTFDSIDKANQTGNKLRKSLRVFWDSTTSDESFMEYLGTCCVDEMNRMLAIGKSNSGAQLQKEPAQKGPVKRSEPSSGLRSAGKAGKQLKK